MNLVLRISILDEEIYRVVSLFGIETGSIEKIILLTIAEDLSVSTIKLNSIDIVEIGSELTLHIGLKIIEEEFEWHIYWGDQEMISLNLRYKIGVSFCWGLSVCC